MLKTLESAGTPSGHSGFMSEGANIFSLGRGGVACKGYRCRVLGQQL